MEKGVLLFSKHVVAINLRFPSSPSPLGILTGELLSQPRPEGVAEIICPKNGSERVNVALVYPPTPTVISPCSNIQGTASKMAAAFSSQSARQLMDQSL
ncbi:hypothetical protein ACRRTK_012814 [Alexandromys fortis]